MEGDREFEAGNCLIYGRKIIGTTKTVLDSSATLCTTVFIVEFYEPNEIGFGADISISQRVMRISRIIIRSDISLWSRTALFHPPINVP